MRTLDRRSAFTLVEMLVIIAILGVLAGLIVPAVQRLRTAALRTECANNLRQVGLAARHFHDTFKRFPPAVTMPYAKQAATPSITDISGVPPFEILNDSNARINSDPNYPFGPNWAVYLLPYVDQEPLYLKAQVGDYLAGYKSGNTVQRDRWRGVVKNQTIPVYLCPADRGPDVPFEGYPKAAGPWARGNYAANAGPGWWQMSLNGASYNEAYGKTGPVMGINFGVAVPKIADGSATTILFTEVRIGVNGKDPRGTWAMGFPGSSVTAANAIGDCPVPNSRNDSGDDLEGCRDFWYQGIGSRDCMGCSKGFLDLGWPSWQAQAHSAHLTGVNVCFADGSVRFVSNYVLQGVWFSMLSANDGVPYSYDD